MTVKVKPFMNGLRELTVVAGVDCVYIDKLVYSNYQQFGWVGIFFVDLKNPKILFGFKKKFNELNYYVYGNCKRYYAATSYFQSWYTMSHS